MGKTEKELADLIAKRLDLPVRTGREYMRLLLEMVRDDLSRTGRSELRGLGIFAVQQRPARKANHPKTGAPVEIPERKAIRFRASKALKDAINKPKGKKPGRRKRATEPADAVALGTAGPTAGGVGEG